MTQRLICESCENGYPTHLWACPHCGAIPDLAHAIELPRRRCDTECYSNYWSCQFDNPPVAFQMFPGHPLDRDGLRKALTTSTLVTFNGNNYDIPIITLAMAGADNVTLKAASDMIIVGGMKSWNFYKHFSIQQGDWDHIDIMEVAPGQGGLKAYGGKMHTRKMQDLPIEPSASIELFDRCRLREYCFNDLTVTSELEQSMRAQIQLREEIGAEFGIDVRSKSDAQIAEAVMKAILPFKVERPSVAVGAQFNFKAAPWLAFVTPALQSVLAAMTTLPFVINPSGGVSASMQNRYVDWGDDQVRQDMHGQFVKRPKGWQSEPVRIGLTTYTMGTGGLHSTEASTTWRASATHRLLSPDVASYYPSLILRTGIYPRQIGEIFASQYKEWYDKRLTAKALGDKKRANSLKTFLNGTFGKLGSQYSIFYAPSELIQVTITGQLALLMLIEQLELCGVPVISANTDGIVVYCPVERIAQYEQCVKWWEQTTQFVMETTEFSLLAARDVNSYVAITTDGDVKTKGAYAPPVPGPSGWPNPTTQVCVDAVIAYLRDGVPLEATIVSCTDVRQFVSVRAVKGGGQWQGEYLGKTVRWYYATGGEPIRYCGSGNKVAKTDGCRPLMELPDVMPADVDYVWYVNEARSLLLDLGIPIG